MGLKERRQRDKERRRAEILDAARALLFEKGMASVSMNQIADAAEVSVGTLYLYFASKEEIFVALQEEGLDILHDMIAEAAGKASAPEARLLDIALAYLEFSERYRTLFDIINYFLSSPESMFPADLKTRIDRHGDRILSIVEEVLSGSGNGRGGDATINRRQALAFWSTLHGTLQFRKLANTVLYREDHRDIYLFSAKWAIRSLFVPEG